MIFQAPPASSAAPPIAVVLEERAASSLNFHASAGVEPPPPPEQFVSPVDGDTLQMQAGPAPVLEDFDWSRPRLNREFIRLEQKALARKASLEEVARYQAMLRHRNSRIFAERYFNDYAEIRRLRKLSEKLAEIQQYLRPIRLG